MSKLFRDLVAGTDKDGKAFRPILVARPKAVGDHIRKRYRFQLASLYAGMDPSNKDLSGKYTYNVDAKDGTKGNSRGPGSVSKRGRKMNLWVIWPLGITIWITIGWIAFAIFERLGIKHNNTAGYITLSFFVYTITQKMPVLIFAIGLCVGLFWGGLAVHFWAHWCPPGSVSEGMLALPFSFN